MPGLLSGPVSLTVIFLLTWLIRRSCAQIWTDEVSDMQYGRLGANVTLACGKAKIRTPVVWHLNHSAALPWHQVTSDGSLVLHHVDHSAEGVYVCHDNQGLLLHSVRLRLGHPPGLLSISCQVPNHTHVRCSWVDSVKTFLPPQYIASFRNGQGWKPCVVDVIHKHCDIEDSTFWQPTHTLNVTEVNALGSQTTVVWLRLQELLKPDPPESLKVEEVESHPKRLSISWKHPSSWPRRDAFPLIFQIRYRPKGSEYWSDVYSEDSSIVIFDALAGHVHQVQVRARDEVNSDTQWSEWTPVSLARTWQVSTTPDPPEEPPPPEYIFPFNPDPETSTMRTHSESTLLIG
uniref:Fibronectin type-III domain-containing protein n=1 Tax=Cynoglossus semilaevis TaxID=244447 RepID=A0A3P8X2N6_CYNSE